MNLGDRIKLYERASSDYLTPKTPVVIRIDGKAFHTYTRGLEKPFCQELVNAMIYACQQTAMEMMGFTLAYCQSDECTFLLLDTKRLESESWFGNKQQKLVSISASIFTAYFNQYANKFIDANKIAFFDSRAFSVPIHDVPNVFIWRQQDWHRNSIEMYARSFFSHKELHKKNQSDMHEMLHGIGENWANLELVFKNGTFVFSDYTIYHNKFNYSQIQEIINEVNKGE